MNTQPSTVLLQCHHCKKTFEVDEEKGALWRAYDLQDGKNPLSFCCPDHIKLWADMKATSLWIILALCAGLLVLLIHDLIVGKGSSFPLSCCLIPYMIRHTSGRWSGAGIVGEIFLMGEVLLGSITLIFPIVMIIREINMYKRIRRQVKYFNAMKEELEL